RRWWPRGAHDHRHYRRLSAGPDPAGPDPMPSVVALVSSKPDDRLVRYLEDVGFEVRAARAPLGAPREGTLVWLTDEHSDERTVIDTVRVWLGAKPKLRAIIVSDRPARLSGASDDARGRVLLLAGPVFRWQPVDALWAEACP